MSDDMILLLYLFAMFAYACIAVIVVLVMEDKTLYTIALYKGLGVLLKSNENKTVDELIRQLERFYVKFIQMNPGAKKYYPSFLYWMDLVMLQINIERRRVKKISQYQPLINEIIVKYERDNPFIKCTDYQQELLQDMEKLLNSENEIPLSNVIHRTEQEFIRLSAEIKKNDRFNKISIAVGICGIIVSVIMAFIKF